MVRNQGNQRLDINTADIPPFMWWLSSILWHFCHYITDSTFPSKQRDLCWGSFRNLRSICRPQDRSFFARHGRRAPSLVTTAALCSNSHTLSSTGSRSSRPSTSLGRAPFLTAAKPHPLPTLAPQPSPRLSLPHRKYAAGPLASISRCSREAASVSGATTSVANNSQVKSLKAGIYR